MWLHNDRGYARLICCWHAPISQYGSYVIPHDEHCNYRKHLVRRKVTPRAKRGATSESAKRCCVRTLAVLCLLNLVLHEAPGIEVVHADSPD